MPQPTLIDRSTGKGITVTRLYVRHMVTDYATWRKVYDAFDEERQSMGVTADAVYRSIDDSNDVTVWHDFDSDQAAKSFASSERLKEVMTDAGVASDPEIWFVTEA
jgi:hypothetical protein